MRGRIQVHPRGFGFVVDESDEGATSAFVVPPDLNRFLADDVVECRVEGDQKKTARDLRLLQRCRTTLVGTSLHRAGRSWLRVDRAVANTDWPLDDVPDAHQPEGVWVEARVRGDVAVFVRVIDDSDAPVTRLLARHRLRGEHPPEVLAACESLPAPAKGDRLDLRDLVTVTIDAPSSRDLDDALSALPPEPDGAMRVFVSVSDVDSVVTRGSVLDREARARSTSVYLPGIVLPMLPHQLSDDLLSLNEGQERLALTVELRVDTEGRVTAVDVLRTLIRSHARLSYDDVAAFLDDGQDERVPKAVHATLRCLRAVAARLSVARAGRGGVEVDRAEASVRVDEGGEPTAVEVRSSNVAHLLVERLMVAANEAVARWLVERGLPGIFRVHEPPSPERVAALEAAALGLGVVAGFPTADGQSVLTPLALAAFDRQVRGTSVAAAIDAAARRLLGPARYTARPGMHFGLAAPLYLHFTSPIRRYADLVVHRIVKAFLEGRRAGFDEIADLDEGDPFERLASDVDEAARRASRAENERVRALTARLFSRRIGERFHGVVVAIRPGGALIQLPGALASLPAEGLSYALGSHISVVIVAADEELGRIDVVPG